MLPCSAVSDLVQRNKCVMGVLVVGNGMLHGEV